MSTAVAENRVLLPQVLKPLRYKLDLVPDLTKFTFEGKVLQPSLSLSLNHLSLSLSTISLSLSLLLTRVWGTPGEH
jgi:hypothetical protein